MQYENMFNIITIFASLHHMTRTFLVDKQKLTKK